jgi:hypothetical protein
MVNAVTWAGEAKKFYEKNKGKNGINTFGDALKSPELKKQYKLAKKHNKLPKKGGNNEPVMDGGEEPVMDGGEEPVMDGGEEPLMDGGYPENEAVMDDSATGPEAGMDGEEEQEIIGGKKRKTTKKSKKAKKTVKKTKTAKKQKKGILKLW